MGEYAVSFTSTFYITSAYVFVKSVLDVSHQSLFSLSLTSLTTSHNPRVHVR